MSVKVTSLTISACNAGNDRKILVGLADISNNRPYYTQKLTSESSIWHSAELPAVQQYIEY
jgi:hypothetical protein